MVIEIPGCKFRIASSNTDWQIQYPGTKNGEEVWTGKYFFPSLDFAVCKAYELALKDNDATVDMRGLPGECKKVKELLVRAVRRAVE